MGWISQRVKTIVLSRVRTSYSSYLRISHTFFISPRTSPKLGLVLTLCEIDPLEHIARKDDALGANKFFAVLREIK